MKPFTLLMLLMTLWGCGSRTLEIPEGIIPKKEMVLIMTDIQLIEAAKSSNLIPGNTWEQIQENQLTDYAVVLRNRGVTEKQFKESFSFYREHPKELKNLYKEILVELSRQQAEINANHTGSGTPEKPPSPTGSPK